MKIPLSAVSFMTAELVKKKMVPGEFVVDVPNESDILLLLEGFLEWARVRGKLSDEGAVDLSSWFETKAKKK